MPSFSIVHQVTGGVFTSGTVSTDAAVDIQNVPAGHVLLKGIIGIPGRHKFVNGERVDLPQAPAAPAVDRVDALIEALKTKGVNVTGSDLSAAVGRLKKG